MWLVVGIGLVVGSGLVAMQEAVHFGQDVDAAQGRGGRALLVVGGGFVALGRFQFLDVVADFGVSLDRFRDLRLVAARLGVEAGQVQVEAVDRVQLLEEGLGGAGVLAAGDVVGDGGPEAEVGDAGAAAVVGEGADDAGGAFVAGRGEAQGGGAVGVAGAAADGDGAGVWGVRQEAAEGDDLVDVQGRWRTPG